MVPSSPKQKEIPFARVNHNKYMVTDKIAYIGKAVHTHAVVCFDKLISFIPKIFKYFKFL